MYLFDTDVLSNIVKKSPSPFLIEKLRQSSPAMQFTSAINMGEIYYGALRTSYSEKIISAFEERVFPVITILPFDDGAAKVYGRLKAKLEKKGIVKSEPDLRIASVAIQHRLMLITGNIKHFEHIPGLEIENWIA